MTPTELATAIADDVFQNAYGAVARRLVLKLPDGSDGGAWSKQSFIEWVARRIEKCCGPSLPDRER